MKILHLIETLEVGGAERVVVDLAISQKNNDHTPVVCTLYNKGTLEKDLENNDIEVWDCRKKVIGGARSMLKLIKFAATLGPDVIHSHNRMANYYAAVAKLAVCPRTPLVNTLHNAGGIYADNRKKKLYGLSLYLTDNIVGVCNAATKMIREQHCNSAGKLRTIYNGVVDSDQTVSDKCNLKKVLGLDDDVFIIGVVARLHPVKNHAMLIRAIARLPEETSIHAAIIGDGCEKARLNQMIKDYGLSGRIHFLGQCKNVPSILRSLDCFILPSKSEGHSIALLEAAMTGLPIIATAVGGNTEIITHNNTGILVPTDDDNAMASAIKRIKSNPSLRTTLGDNAKEWAKHNATLSAMFNNYEELYRGLRRQTIAKNQQ